MKPFRVRQRLTMTFALLTTILSMSSSGTILASPQMQGTARQIDVTISLHSSPTSDTDRAPYERIVEYFADGVYESSNGAHKIRKVSIYSGGDFADKADILWVATCHPNAWPSGRSVEGQHINMCDQFGSTDFLANDSGWKGGGYTLAHEWGHYFYSLYDEYRGTDSKYDSLIYMPHTTDDAVPNSIMNSQWNARGGDYKWLNFSTAKNNTKNTAQHRVYDASGWETLSRPLADDPRDGDRKARPKRIPYDDLAAVAPGDNEDPSIELPSADARSELEIVWVSDDTTFQIVIDHSGSMSADMMANAKTAAKLLVDLAEINHTTVGVIKFDDAVTVVQPLTAIDSEATKDTIKAAIDTIQSDGNTAIGDAAQKALDDLLAYGAEDTNRVVYLLTDGQNNTGVAPLSVVPAYQSAQIPLFTFGFGSGVNASVLQQMAQDTGGKYYFSPTTLAELTRVFQDANQLTSPSAGITEGSATVLTSIPSSFPFYVDSTLDQLDIVITYQGSPSDATLTLLDPYSNSSGTGDCSASGTETLCLFSIDAPTPGDWTLQVLALNSDMDLTYRVNGSAENAITYAASVNSLTGDVVQYPEPIVLLAILGKEWPIMGAVANATVQQPDGTIAQISLQDNGVAPDAYANDGLYSAILDYTQSGSYNITVQFDNSAGAAHLTELSFAPSIGPDGEAIPVADPIPVTENFERFSRIQVNVENVQTDDHGNYTWNATALPADNTDVPGKIDYQSDVDLFRINAPSTGGLVLRVSNLALGMDPRLRVLASDTTTVLTDVDLTGSSSDNGYLYVPIIVPAGDVIYAEVSHRNSVAGGLYEISAGASVSSDIGGLALPSPVYLPLIARSWPSFTGFNSQFNGSALGWQSHSGTWTVDSNYYSTTGLANIVSSASYTGDFTNFDYQARLWRNGCDWCANRLIIRGTPTPLGSNNNWNRSYLFQYTRSGSYSVWKIVGGSSTPLQGWTSSSAINQGSAWNTLRVVANGSNFYFYINGTLVWSGSDTSLTSGRVGIGMYRSSDSTGDQLWVDWATLSPLDASGFGAAAVTDTVSAEQQALNDAAHATRGEEDHIDFAEAR